MKSLHHLFGVSSPIGVKRHRWLSLSPGDHPVEAIMGKSQKKEHSGPRQLAMYLCRKQLALPYTSIGDTFARDHSTVMPSTKRVEEEVRRSGSELQSVASVIARDL